MKKRQNFVYSPIFWRYFMTYLIVLAIPMTVVLYDYNESNKRLKDELKSTVEQLLQQSSYVIDGSLKEVNRLADQISVDKTISSVISNNSISLYDYSLYDLRNIQEKLISYKNSNDLIQKICIITKNKVVISDDIVTDSLEFYYKTNIMFENTGFQAWYESLFGTQTYYYDKYFPSGTIYYNGVGKRVIVFLKTIPANDIYDPSSVLMIMLSEEGLMESLGNFRTEGGWAYVLDKDENIITSINDSPSFRKNTDMVAHANNSAIREDSIFVSQLSKMNNWLYVASYPSNNVKNEMQHTLATLILIALFTFLSGIVVSAIFSGNQANHVNSLASAVAMEMGVRCQRNIFRFLNDSINQLVRNKNILQERVEAGLPLIKAAYLEKLLKGEFVSNEELIASFSGIQTNICFSNYLVVLIQINDFSSNNKSCEIARLNLFKNSIANYAVHLQDGPTEVHSTNGNRIALIYCREDCARLKETVESLAVQLKEYTSKDEIHLSFGAGNLYGTAQDIYLSYSEAVETLDYIPQDIRQLVVWYEDMPKQNNFYFYPLEFETRLINLTRTGNAVEVEGTLDKLFEENFKNRTLSKEQRKYLLYEINGTFMKIFCLQKEDKGVTTLVNKRLELLRDQRTIDDVCCEIRNLFAMACNLGKESSLQKNENIYRRIAEIINDEYANPQLSLKFVANKLNLNDNYFSRLFKELFDMSFSDYVENIRLSKAQSILNETEMPISDVACIVGYNSAYVFRRAFKRVYGLLPKQSRA